MKSKKEEKPTTDIETNDRKEMLKFQKRAFEKIIKEINKDLEKNENNKDLEKKQ